MNILNKIHGFGSFLEAEEELVGVFRQEFSYALSHIVVHGVLWWGWAWVVWFFFPFKLMPVWIGLYLAGIVHTLGTLLWWYYNAVILTNMNLIIVDWKKPFEKHVTRIDYWNLDEIVVQKQGIGSFMYHYGNLVFRKLSDGEPITYKRIGNPHRIATIIDDFKEKMVHDRNFSTDSGIRDLLSQVIGRHVESDEGFVPPTLKNRLNGNFGKASGGFLGALGAVLFSKSRQNDNDNEREGDLALINKDVHHYRTHWTDYLPWRKQRTIKTEKKTTEEGIMPTDPSAYVTPAKPETQNDKIVHHHHYYAHGENKNTPEQKMYTEKKNQPITVSRFTRTEIEKQDHTNIHEKKLDDSGGIALHLDKKY